MLYLLSGCLRQLVRKQAEDGGEPNTQSGPCETSGFNLFCNTILVV